MITASEKAYSLIRSFEGLRLKAYKCSAGKYTIGYGHTNRVKAWERITPEHAEELLERDVKAIEDELNKIITVDLTQNQMDAIISFVFNVGVGNFKSSTAYKRIQAKRFEDVPAQIKRWVYCRNKVLNGLVKRREAEAKLFMEG